MTKPIPRTNMNREALLAHHAARRENDARGATVRQKLDRLRTATDEVGRCEKALAEIAEAQSQALSVWADLGGERPPVGLDARERAERSLANAKFLAECAAKGAGRFEIEAREIEHRRGELFKSQGAVIRTVLLSETLPITDELATVLQRAATLRGQLQALCDLLAAAGQRGDTDAYRALEHFGPKVRVVEPEPQPASVSAARESWSKFAAALELDAGAQLSL